MGISGKEGTVSLVLRLNNIDLVWKIIERGQKKQDENEFVTTFSVNKANF